MAKLSEWLKIMLGEIARKQEDAAKAAAELKQRETRNPPRGRRDKQRG